MRVSRMTLALAGTLTLSGCGLTKKVFHSSKPPVQAVEVDFAARALINPDAGNHPFSVSVRAYQLRDHASFDGASYDDLFKKDKAVLGEDFQDVMTAIVEPSGAARLNQSLKPDTQYVGVVAFYRDITASHAWRLVVPRKEIVANTPLRFELIESDIRQIMSTKRKKSK